MKLVSQRGSKNFSRNRPMLKFRFDRRITRCNTSCNLFAAPSRIILSRQVSTCNHLLTIYGLETVVSVLFSNTRTRLLYNEREIFNTARSEAECSIENFEFIVQ